jgi:hypothetical protein
MVFHEPPGSYDVCPICYWEDDHVQLRWVDWAGGANRPNLIDAQAAFASFGAMEHCFLASVRRPKEGDARDADWRPASTADAEPRLPGVPHEAYPDDMTRLYYWRTSYWRAR